MGDPKVLYRIITRHLDANRRRAKSDPVPYFRDPEKIKYTILLVFLTVFCVAPKATTKKVVPYGTP